MKKAIWGYNIHEVDESVDYLETQNIKLEKQVRQLSEDLEKVRGELRLYEESAKGADGADGENEEITAELRAELDSLKLAYEQSEKEREKSERERERSEKERKSLSEEVSRLNSKLAEQGAVFADVGNICRLAYEDMHNSKRRAKESVENFLKIFWGEWEEYQRRVCDLSAEIKRRQQESRNFFIESADKILQVYGSMNQNNREFENGLSEITDVKNSMQAKLEELLAGLDDDVEDDDVGDGEDSIRDAEGDLRESSRESGYECRKEDEAHSIIRSIEAMHGNKIYEKDMHENGVHENGVHENDIRGNSANKNSIHKNSIYKNSGFLGRDGDNNLSEAEAARKRSVNRDSERFGEQKSEAVWKSVRAAAKEEASSDGRSEKFSRNDDNDYISENVCESAETGAGTCGDNIKTDGQGGARPNQSADVKEGFSISSEVNVRNII